MRDWHTHVFTSTYTADVSGVCSVMYELGGMTILHDPSGCNSTYTTHDEPRWYDTDSLMYVSGLDEMSAIYGDDSVIIADAIRAAGVMKPKFITLCGASIPHIIAFDYKGVAHLIEKETGIPVLPVPTDGLKSYVSGVGLATREWIKRFADRGAEKKYGSVNLLGVTPIDFSRQENVDDLKAFFSTSGREVNGCFAMGDTFENLRNICAASVNVVASSAGRVPARFLFGKEKIPSVEGLPIGPGMRERLLACIREAELTGKNLRAYEDLPEESEVLVIGEEIFAKSLATEINYLYRTEGSGRRARALWPDVNEGFDEEELLEAIDRSKVVIADPLFRVAVRNRETAFVDFPHEGYSGRIYRERIPRFLSADFPIGSWMEHVSRIAGRN
uniref:nitrogenase component 1 n=1 Tax=Eubacterium cellulosolvens TaxID=29322 RepID=UPI000482A413|nr:nitrogenase component 1 [[Eubacterium] cellulosolvens]